VEPKTTADVETDSGSSEDETLANTKEAELLKNPDNPIYKPKVFDNDLSVFSHENQEAHGSQFYQESVPSKDQVPSLSEFEFPPKDVYESTKDIEHPERTKKKYFEQAKEKDSRPEPPSLDAVKEFIRKTIEEQLKAGKPPDIKYFDAAIVYDKNDYSEALSMRNDMKAIIRSHLNEDLKIELFDSVEFSQSMVLVVEDVVNKAYVILVYLSKNTDNSATVKFFVEEAVGLTRLQLCPSGSPLGVGNDCQFAIRPVHTEHPSRRGYKTPVGLITTNGIAWYDKYSQHTQDTIVHLMEEAIRKRKRKEREANTRQEFNYASEIEQKQRQNIPGNAQDRMTAGQSAFNLPPMAHRAPTAHATSTFHAQSGVLLTSGDARINAPGSSSMYANQGSFPGSSSFTDTHAPDGQPSYLAAPCDPEAFNTPGFEKMYDRDPAYNDLRFPNQIDAAGRANRSMQGNVYTADRTELFRDTNRPYCQNESTSMYAYGVGQANQRSQTSPRYPAIADPHFVAHAAGDRINVEQHDRGHTPGVPYTFVQERDQAYTPNYEGYGYPHTGPPAFQRIPDQRHYLVGNMYNQAPHGYIQNERTSFENRAVNQRLDHYHYTNTVTQSANRVPLASPEPTPVMRRPEHTVPQQQRRMNVQSSPYLDQGISPPLDGTLHPISDLSTEDVEVDTNLQPRVLDAPERKSSKSKS